MWTSHGAWTGMYMWGVQVSYFEICNLKEWLINVYNQTELPEDGKPICITLYADKTHLSSFGSEQGYPIMAQINNSHVQS